MRLNTRVLLPLLLLAGAYILGAGYLLNDFRNLNRALSSDLDRVETINRTLATLASFEHEIQNRFLFFYFERDPGHLQRLRELEAQADAALGRLGGLITSSQGHAQLDAYLEARSAATTLQQRLIRNLDAPNAAGATHLFARWQNQGQVVDAIRADLVGFHNNGTGRALQAASASQRHYTHLLVGLAAVAIVLILTTAWYFRRRITLPLTRLSETARMLSSDLLNEPLRLSNDDELAALAQTFTSLSSRLLEAKSALERQLVLGTEELAESQQRYIAIVQTVVDGIVTIDARGIIVSLNPAAEKMFGYPAGELIGKNVSALMPEPDRSRHDGYIEHYLRTGEARIIGIGREVSGQRSDGSTFTMDLAVSEMTVGGRRMFTGVIRDITARKEAEQALLAAKNAAEEANRAKSVFLSRMSHELRTPLNAILGFAQVLQFDDEPQLTEQQRDSVEHIYRAGRHLLDLINDVLDLARVEANKLVLSIEPVALPGLVDEALELIGPLAEERQVTLSRDTFQDQSVAIMADRVRLMQVLVNLLSNAVKYNRPGGHVSVSCYETDRGYVRLTINDTGFGIPEDQLEKLFEPFERLARDERTEGSGIGLAVSKRLVELMQGRIGAANAPEGQGCAFWFEVPLASGYAPPVVESADSQPIAAATPGGSHTLLYVEDNPSNLALVTQILRKRPGIRVLTAPSAELGVDLARVHHPDLILLDINLPGMDGFEALARLRQFDATTHTPVVALSAAAMPSDVQKGLDAGFDGYLTKPINVQGLLQVVDEHLEPQSTAAQGSGSRQADA